MVGCNFCPFAAKELKRGSIHYEVLTGATTVTTLETVMTLVDQLDSNSTNEMFSIIGKKLSYSVTYSGRNGPDQKDEEKKCVLTDEQVNKILTTLQDKKLNADDSLIYNLPATEAPYTSETITILVTKGKKITKVRVKGIYTQIANKTLYTNSLYLINVIRNMLKKCS